MIFIIRKCCDKRLEFGMRGAGAHNNRFFYKQIDSPPSKPFQKISNIPFESLGSKWSELKMTSKFWCTLVCLCRPNGAGLAINSFWSAWICLMHTLLNAVHCGAIHIDTCRKQNQQESCACYIAKWCFEEATKSVYSVCKISGKNVEIFELFF